MSVRTLWNRLGRRGRLRRAAARGVLEPLEPGTDRQDPDNAAMAIEEEAMQSLVATLTELPREAWDLAVVEADVGVGVGVAGAGARVRAQVKARTRLTPRQTLALAAVSACLLVAFLVGSLTHPTLSGSNRLTAQTPRVALEPLPGSDRDSHAVAYMTGGDGMRLRVAHLAPSAPGTYYELWLMSSDSDLVSVTSFRVGHDGNAALTLRLPADPNQYRFLDISVQRVGSGTAISDDSVLRGAIG